MTHESPNKMRTKWQILLVTYQPCSVIIANTCLDSKLKYGISGVLCKLNLEKAYDHVNREFLSYLLGHLGFGSKWRKWISYCISKACLSILINGSPHGFFASSRGLHQGDPHSSHPFVIVMEALSKMLSRAMIRGDLFGFRVDSQNPVTLEISNLLFAYDSLVM
jgi:hypothetical protein